MRRQDRPGAISTEQRNRMLARPLVRRAVELSGGSITHVLRRGDVPAESADDAAPAAPETTNAAAPEELAEATDGANDTSEE